MADTILVPLELPDPEPLSPLLIEDLSSLDVVVLGHYDLPEQTPASSAREQFGDAAQATLDEVAASFADAGASVRTRLVFGKDRAAAIRQVAVEDDCAAELDPAPTEGVERILVPLPDVAEFDRLPRFIRVLSEDSTQRITLFHVVEGEERRERGEAVVSETRDRLVDDGFDADAVDTLVVEGDEHDEEILRVAADYDAVVMYEPQSRLGDRVFGTLADRIADETRDPVIVVDRDY
ncbi:UspA domain protein [Halorubrum distributum JCM 9100]|uniref:UspA domain protein n=2 Tax=Halorubrum distributum TaxID=29283 RepID=M0ENK1_9EURY|nr:universal stress protein [Halorubrum distributum]ELZ49300.1 UspA domain protein [Halorubrum distributum JCM 9100]ELZ57816.1 UspA domain protein [Halorubrum distributum JCM 10118]